MKRQIIHVFGQNSHKFHDCYRIQNDGTIVINYNYSMCTKSVKISRKRLFHHSSSAIILREFLSLQLGTGQRTNLHRISTDVGAGPRSTRPPPRNPVKVDIRQVDPSEW